MHVHLGLIHFHCWWLTVTCAIKGIHQLQYRMTFSKPLSMESSGSFFIVKMRRSLQQAEMTIPSKDRNRVPLNISAVSESRSMHRLHHCTQTVAPYHPSNKNILQVIFRGRFTADSCRVNTHWFDCSRWWLAQLTVLRLKQVRGILACRGVAESSLCMVDK